MLDELFEFFMDKLEVCHAFCLQHPPVPGYSKDKDAPQTLFLAFYLDIQYQRTGTVKTLWFEKLIHEAFQRRDFMFFELLIGLELHIVGIQKGKPDVALDTLRMLFCFYSKNAKIASYIQEFLARLRMHYPNKVDYFLEEANVFLENQEERDNLRIIIQTYEAVEAPARLILHRAGYFVRDEVIQGSSTLRAQLIQLLDKAVDCKNAREWFTYIFRDIVNTIYGEEILQQTKSVVDG